MNLVLLTVPSVAFFDSVTLYSALSATVAGVSFTTSTCRRPTFTVFGAGVCEKASATALYKRSVDLKPAVKTPSALVKISTRFRLKACGPATKIVENPSWVMPAVCRLIATLTIRSILAKSYPSSYKFTIYFYLIDGRWNLNRSRSRWRQVFRRNRHIMDISRRVGCTEHDPHI